MSSPVTPEFVLEGAAYALEQCGLLLRDANILYRSGSYASVVVLTAFAREELGRYCILLDLRRKLLSGESFTWTEIEDRCDDHVTKQRAGMLSTVIVADRDSGVGKLLNKRMMCSPQSPEWQRANAAIKKIQEAKRKRDPEDRHKSRMAALYVGPISEHRWNRPVETTAEVSRGFLEDGVNDYAGRYHQGYISAEESMLKHIDAELYSALEQWADRPVLQAPEWPSVGDGS